LQASLHIYTLVTVPLSIMHSVQVQAEEKAGVHFINTNVREKKNQITIGGKWKSKYLSVINIAQYLFLHIENEKEL